MLLLVAIAVLNFHVKSVCAARTDNGVLAFLLGEAEVVLAGWAFFVDVGLSVSFLAFSELKILFRLVEEL